MPSSLCFVPRYAPPSSERPRRRILLVSLTPFFGGGEVYLLKLARLLQPWHELRALVADEQAGAELEAMGVRSIRVPKERRLLRAAALLQNVCREWKPEVVHLNGQGECHLDLLPWLAGIPTVATRHTELSAPMVSRLMQTLVRVEYRLLTSIVCVSGLVARQLGGFAPKLHLIPNWIAEEGDTVAGRRYQSGKDVFNLLVVGRLAPLKGTLDVIRAMRFLPGATLDIVGDGPQRAELESAAEGLPVRFHGFQSQCAPFFDRADLLVFPSHSEGQGLVPLEAMAHGTPCLLSDIEACIETSNGGRCAALFRCGDVDDLVAKIRALRTAPTRLRELADRGRSRIRSTYSEEAVREPYLSLYEHAAGAQRRHAVFGRSLSLEGKSQRASIAR